jgi:hypothetical protein
MLSNVVSSVSELIDRYGYDLVYGTIVYIGTYGDHLNVRVGDPVSNVYFTISKDQFRSIGDFMRADYKIAAIKMLREITSCALKEAKDVVEATRW